MTASTPRTCQGLLVLLVLLLPPCSAVCFDKLLLTTKSAHSIRPLAHVQRVAQTKQCAELCVRETECAAVRYSSTDKKCVLLSQHHQHVEEPSPNAVQLVEVWRREDRALGKCPPDFDLRWGSSRYMLSVDEATWAEAVAKCEEQGGSKLAELMTLEEQKAVRKMVKNNTEFRYFIGGKQESGAKEPDGGWMWYRSGVSIVEDRSHWMASQPDNSGTLEHVLTLETFDYRFSDTAQNKRLRYLCECVTY